MSHRPHPDTHTHGLADDCERCAEHASQPLRSLDSGNVLALIERVKAGEEPRSETEAAAMTSVRRSLDEGRMLLDLGVLSPFS